MDQQPPDLEVSIGESLSGETSAQELHAMRQLLEARLRRMRAAFAVAGEAEPSRLAKQIEALEQQIAVLQEEATIAQFVEESIGFAWNARRLSEGR